MVAPDADPIDDAGSDNYREAYLYDLEADPYELTNLVGLPSHREVSDHLRGRLVEWMTVAGQEQPVIEPAVRADRARSAGGPRRRGRCLTRDAGGAEGADGPTVVSRSRS